MTEEESELLHRRPGARDGDVLLYDYFKHLTTLALLTLGGVLAVSETADPEDVKPVMVVIVLALVAISGALAFGGSSEIVRAHATGKPLDRSLDAYRLASPALLAVGVGMYLYMFADSLT